MYALLKSLWKDESGQGLVEYGLLVGFVAIMVVAASLLFSNAANNIFVRLDSYLSDKGAS